jgi:hypothetical protein
MRQVTTKDSPKLISQKPIQWALYLALVLLSSCLNGNGNGYSGFDEETPKVGSLSTLYVCHGSENSFIQKIVISQDDVSAIVDIHYRNEEENFTLRLDHISSTSAEQQESWISQNSTVFELTINLSEPMLGGNGNGYPGSALLVLSDGTEIRDNNLSCVP